MDNMDRNRHVFTKGRLEFMGGPIAYEQGHGIPGFEDQERKIVDKDNPHLDPVVKALGVDLEDR